jgi:hypothetical protein
MTAEREQRLVLDEAARLAPNDWSSVEIRILELTASGFRAASDVTLREGALVTLEIPGLGPAAAFVSWRRAGQFAAAFAEPIDLAGAGFTPLNREIVLARLLGERAAAHAAGKSEEERGLRRRILRALPVRTGGEPAPDSANE